MSSDGCSRFGSEDSESLTPTTVSAAAMVIKFLCSYGGRIMPRLTDGQLRYVGGYTRVLSVDRSISFAELMVKLGEFCGASVRMRCQLPDGDLETLISITSDDDLRLMMALYDKATNTSSTPHPLKIRAILSPPKSLKSISPPPSPLGCYSPPSAAVKEAPYVAGRRPFLTTDSHRSHSHSRSHSLNHFLPQRSNRINSFIR
ncbi:unnamed protein product [Rhodiola kirilowii]